MIVLRVPMSGERGVLTRSCDKKPPIPASGRDGEREHVDLGRGTILTFSHDELRRSQTRYRASSLRRSQNS